MFNSLLYLINHFVITMLQVYKAGQQRNGKSRTHYQGSICSYSNHVAMATMCFFVCVFVVVVFFGFCFV